MANPENKQIPYESTQQDIRDAIESVATAIGGIAIPSADHVSYDNSGSGLSATDVQNALDEIVSDIPTVNNGTLTIQQNGTSKGSFTANSASNVNVNIETPTADKKTATDQFTTADGGLLSKCQINLVPVQSGSGDPYPAGGGKNKLPLTLDTIKEAMNYVTWTGNSTVVNNVTFTVLEDDAGNVSGIKANGTASATIYFVIAKMSQMTWVKNTSIIINGCPTGGGASTYELMFYIYNGSNSARDFGEGSAEFTPTEDTSLVQIVIRSGVTVSNIVFYPMLRLSSVTDPTFAPYSNICPISGHTEVDLYNVGKNRQVLTVEDIKSVSAGGVTWVGNSCVINNVTYTILTNSKNEVVGIKTNGTASGLSQITISKTYVKEGSYTFSSGVTGSNSTYYMRYVVRDSNGAAISIDGSVFIDVYNIELTRALPSNASYVNGYIGVINGVQANNLVFKPMIRLATETDSTFEPYLGHLYQVQIGSTVYGGSLDIVSGSGEDAYTNIASYNGETINEPWISSMDVYTEGGTPTTGSQVVYPKTTATAISTTPQQIEALVGQNNLSTPLDGQSIDSVEYREVFAFDDVEKVVSLRVPISMLGTDESGRTTASQSYASGDYFYKDGYMCKALTSISAGATLTLNTNYSQGTLADILKAIENA